MGEHADEAADDAELAAAAEHEQAAQQMIAEAECF